VVSHIADHVAVMYRGEVLETGDAHCASRVSIISTTTVIV